ncbi:MAG: Flp family type IVb pilin [Stellaceae bacterium]
MMIVRKLGQCLFDETGATAIEYGLIAALISVAAISVLQLTGTNLVSTFTTVANNL